MSAQPTYAEIVELLPAYVLGALEPDEMLAVEDYLGRSAALLERLRALEEAAPMLALSAPDTPLSPAVKDSLLARARAGASTPLPDLPGQLAEPSVSSRLQTLFRAVGRQRRVLELIAAAGERYTLDSESSAARGAFYRDGARGALIAEHLPALPGDQDYQVWLVADRPVSVGLLPRAPDGRAELLVAVPAALPFESVAISIEPAGGSEQPVGPIVMRGATRRQQ